jgi:hypothetical protein
VQLRSPKNKLATPGMVAIFANLFLENLWHAFVKSPANAQ